MVFRTYVEKRQGLAPECEALLTDCRDFLGVQGLRAARIWNRYDVEGIEAPLFENACRSVFSEPPLDLVSDAADTQDACAVFAVEPLPGQFDQRADSASQCIQLLSQGDRPRIRTAKVYALYGTLTDADVEAVKRYVINPVESREASLKKPETLAKELADPKCVSSVEGFTAMDEAALSALLSSMGLAMDIADLKALQDYFRETERRDPTVTELRVVDTYWSDHCRHTTFSTELKDVKFDDGFYKKPIEETYNDYLNTFKNLYEGRSDKFVCLMDIALLAMKRLKKEGKLQDQEESDEINACSIVVPVEVDGQTEEWLVNFKNETHNHPTEIEPFGGAATCLGGAIRDPLSGRTYVYQAMRVTGAADPTVSVKDTLPGKLPQKKIVREAAHGYSSYGNQIGLATGYVKEVYHPDYVAKRMEIGAVMGAAPRRAVQRLTSDPGDIIILLGGRTGRDGIGGATGSSKAHNTQSTSVCGAEVQKGNAPTERKIQRLFRREEVAHIIKKCNDFGAGGVSVAIGELADGLRINLDKVPKKYAGLDGTELAISESQERMAVVVAPEDVKTFLGYAAEENLEAVEVAVVTEDPRLVLEWRGKEIVNLSRAFLDTNGAHQETNVEVEMPEEKENYFKKIAAPKVAEAVAANDMKAAWMTELADLNVCSQKGLVEMFDGSIGVNSVYMPFGGKYQLTETQSMVAKLPVAKGDCDTVTMMSYGFDPYLSSWSPYHGSVYAVLESLSRIVTAGGDYKKVRFTFQEYFRRMSEDPKRWSQPFAALLGAYNAQIGFGLPSIGGKDSMSGTFNDIDVPPTLVSFAVDIAKEKDIITPELKAVGDQLVLFTIKKDEFDLPDYAQVMKLYDTIHALIQAGVIVSAYALDGKGLAAAVSKMAFGNKLGITVNEDVSKETLFAPGFGNIVAEVPAEKVAEVKAAFDAAGLAGYEALVGWVNEEESFIYGDMRISMEEALHAWTATLEKVFPTRATENKDEVKTGLYKADNIYVCKNKVAKPTVFIPVFPGTNCEYDSADAFERAGANTIVKVFKNMNANDIRESVDEFVKAIEQSQIIMFPGGFSAGDEPDGSAKFFATAFQNAKIKEAVMKLLNERDGLALGICNGFQALVKLGLLPYGEIRDLETESPTLTFNNIGRHVSQIVDTRIVSNKSPWLSEVEPGDIHAVAVSHGEGRFYAPESVIKELFKNGQVATQYVDPQGVPTMEMPYNPNGSLYAIEGITSPDGRVFGKMCHSERFVDGLYRNITGNKNQKIFVSGVNYFK